MGGAKERGREVKDRERERKTEKERKKENVRDLASLTNI